MKTKLFDGFVMDNFFLLSLRRTIQEQKSRMSPKKERGRSSMSLDQILGEIFILTDSFYKVNKKQNYSILGF
jgi:hypothetical protein